MDNAELTMELHWGWLSPTQTYLEHVRRSFCGCFDATLGGAGTQRRSHVPRGGAARKLLHEAALQRGGVHQHVLEQQQPSGSYGVRGIQACWVDVFYKAPKLCSAECPAMA